MPEMYANHTVVVARPDERGQMKQVELEANKVHEFSDDEIRDLEPFGSLREPVNESFGQVARPADEVPNTVPGMVPPRVVDANGNPVLPGAPQGQTPAVTPEEAAKAAKEAQAAAEKQRRAQQRGGASTPANSAADDEL